MDSNDNNHRAELVPLAKAIAVAAVLLSLLLACAPPSGSPAPNAVGNYDHLSPDEKVAMSDVLADDAEEALSFSGLIDARTKFQEALKLNPSNYRAEFWLEMSKPVLEMRGLVTRIRPLYMKQQGGSERYMILLKGLERDQTPDYRRFVLDTSPENGPVIDSDEKVREYFDRVIVALDVFRKYLKANKDRTYTLRFPQRVVSEKLGKSTDGRCSPLHFGNTRLASCTGSGMVMMKMGRADIEGLQFLTATQILQLSLMYAYKINPMAIFDGYKDRTRKEIVDLIFAGYDGSLLERNRLHLAKEILPDWIVAQKYVIENQDEVCKLGDTKLENRPGYLLAFGVCLSKEKDGKKPQEIRSLELLEAVLAGQPIEVDQRHLPRKVTIYPMRIFEEPAKNLGLLKPLAFDEEDRPAAFSDSAYSRFFGEGSVTDIVNGRLAEDRYNLARQIQLSREIEERVRAENLRNAATPTPAPEATPVPERETNPEVLSPIVVPGPAGETRDDRTNSRRDTRGDRMPAAGAARSNGEISGFRYHDCETDGRCMVVEAPKAWMSQANGAFVAEGNSDKAAKFQLIENGKMKSEFSGDEVILRPEIKAITIESKDRVVLFDIRKNSFDIIEKPKHERGAK